MNRDMKSYYANRAQEYELIYSKPERQSELRNLKSRVRLAFAGQRVLEVACGTGYWTQLIATSSESILAVDCNPEVLAIAASKSFATEGCVAFKQADAYDLTGITPDFTSGFFGFWWSHVPKRMMRDFLRAFHGKLNAGSLVMFLDNNYVEGSSTQISRTDDDGNTYQQRTLADGTRYEVLKNFPAKEELEATVAHDVSEVHITKYTYYWCLEYRLL